MANYIACKNPSVCGVQQHRPGTVAARQCGSPSSNKRIDSKGISTMPPLTRRSSRDSDAVGSDGKRERMKDDMQGLVNDLLEISGGENQDTSRTPIGVQIESYESDKGKVTYDYFLSDEEDFMESGERKTLSQTKKELSKHLKSGNYRMDMESSFIKVFGAND